MLDAMDGRVVSPSQSDVDESFLTVRSRWPRKAGDADREVGLASLDRPLGHGSRNDVGNRVILIEQARFDAEQRGFRLLAVSDQAAVEAVTRAFDVGQQ